jgi:hypothetical protein
MSFLRKTFDRLVEHEFHWAGALFRLAFWWISAVVGLVFFFYTFYRMKGMLSTIPPIIQAACVLLILLAVLLMISMFRERRRALDTHSRFLAALSDFKAASPAERAHGIPQEKMALIRRKAGSLRDKPGEWWSALERSLEYYTSPAGDEGWFITRPMEDCLPEQDVVDSFYNSAFHQSVPGILTALGLLATFVAILMALAGVTYNARDPMRPVSGIDQLINGLSGKFLSSILALILSVAFTFLEKKVCDRQLRNSYDALVKRCRDVFPFLTQSRILLDIQRVAVARGYMLGGSQRAGAAERG